MNDDLPTTPGPDASAEPLLKVGGILTGVAAVIALLVSFGLHLSDAQQAAILGVVTVVAPFVVAIVGRRVVWAPATVRAKVEAVTTQERDRKLPTTATTPVVEKPVPGSTLYRDERGEPQRF